jgi:hypothetical protein
VPFSLDGAPKAPSEVGAYCRIHIRNSSRKLVSVKKLSVLAELLRIYIDESTNLLYTSDATATFNEGEEINLGFLDRKPSVDSKLVEANGPRVTSRDHLLRRSMVLLRNITNV